MDDGLTVTGTAGDATWQVSYYEMSTNTDITAKITGAGYLTGSMAAQGYKGIYVKVKPLSGATAGSSKILTLTGASTGDATKKDVVKATTSRS